MKILIFGLGSMGKRRARCLQALGINEITGFDINPKRVEEAQSLNICATTDFASLPFHSTDAFLICTPPDQHEKYLDYGIKFQKPCFVEASVILGKLETILEISRKKNIFIAPSCTLLFHPAIMLIKKLIQEKQYGKITNFSYHCGQYLPDWHPWESVKDFYVSNPLTGGCREIVPFELTWLVHCLGMPLKALACYGETLDVGAKIDDTYAISLQFKDCFGVMLVDVTSRYGIRSLILNFENAQLHWRWDEKTINLYEVATRQWKAIPLAFQESAKGYNENITEEMYINEVKAFLEGIGQKAAFPNNLARDINILKLLHTLEKEVPCEVIS